MLVESMGLWGAVSGCHAIDLLPKLWLLHFSIFYHFAVAARKCCLSLRVPIRKVYHSITPTTTITQR